MISKSDWLRLEKQAREYGCAPNLQKFRVECDSPEEAEMFAELAEGYCMFSLVHQGCNVVPRQLLASHYRGE
jgi:hypothetical protein